MLILFLNICRGKKMTDNVRHLVRLMGADIAGNKALKIGLTRVKGVGKNLATVICKVTKYDPNIKAGTLSDEQLKALEVEIKSIATKVPKWLLNRQKDYLSGEDKHLLASDIDYIQGNDKTRLGRIRSLRGVRLAARLPVRGQRTRGNFRKKKTVVIRKRKQPVR